MKIRALPGYFKSYPYEGSKSINSLKIDPCQLHNYGDWKQLYEAIPKDTYNKQYKLLLLARHGQGYHNAATERYGEDKWNSHWCSLLGDKYGSWVDAQLTPLGEGQVMMTGSKILVPIAKQLGFLPHRFFSSPLRRCLETYIGSWNEVLTRFKYPSTGGESIINVSIIEELRELLNGYTCNHRVPHHEALEQYQNFVTESGVTIHWNYEDGYPELDQLWTPTLRESFLELDTRTNKALEKILKNVTSDERFISITCHSYVIESILRVVDHPAVEKLGTAKIVPLVVEIEI